MKIIAAAARIATGSREKLRLGNLHIERDWGWAPEYVEGMWRVLQQAKAEDFVIASGTSHKLEKFVSKAFELAGLDWLDHVETDVSLLRPYAIAVSRANPAKAAARLGWKATTSFDQVVKNLFESVQERTGV